MVNDQGRQVYSLLHRLPYLSDLVLLLVVSMSRVSSTLSQNRNYTSQRQFSPFPVAAAHTAQSSFEPQQAKQLPTITSFSPPTPMPLCPSSMQVRVVARKMSREC